LLRVHDAEYIRRIADTSGRAVKLDPDTFTSPESYEIARLAAGAGVEAVERVMSGSHHAALALVRPPGHHAERGRAMGFCLFNNVAVGARHAQAKYGVERVAILDFDVHHGQGTQAVVEPDPTLFYGSTHQYPLYPGTGSARETGTDNNVVNVPLAPGSGGAEFRAAWSERILPMLDGFAPQLVIVSAGFDAHAADPLAQLEVETEDFVWLTEELLAIGGTQILMQGGLVPGDGAEGLPFEWYTGLMRFIRVPDPSRHRRGSGAGGQSPEDASSTPMNSGR
jgi:acetoin utilization deacetylase AcuC-like enzyme